MSPRLLVTRVKLFVDESIMIRVRAIPGSLAPALTNAAAGCTTAGSTACQQ